MSDIIKDHDITDIYICGLAGYVCVANTLQDAIRLYPNVEFHILTQFTASLDGGTLLASLEKKY